MHKYSVVVVNTQNH